MRDQEQTELHLVVPLRVGGEGGGRVHLQQNRLVLGVEHHVVTVSDARDVGENFSTVSRDKRGGIARKKTNLVRPKPMKRRTADDAAERVLNIIEKKPVVGKVSAPAPPRSSATGPQHSPNNPTRASTGSQRQPPHCRTTVAMAIMPMKKKMPMAMKVSHKTAVSFALDRLT